MKRIRLRGIVAAVLLAASAHAVAVPATRVDDAQRTQMTDYLVEMFPLHLIFEQMMVLKASELREDLDESQIGCIRGKVSRPAFLARKRREVDAFADEAPQDFQNALALLDSGAGEMMKRLGQYSVLSAIGAESDGKVKDKGKAAEEFDIASQPPDQLVAFMTFAYGSPYKRLRSLSGYGEFTDASEDQPTPVERQIDAMAAEIASACVIPEKFFE